MFYHAMLEHLLTVAIPQTDFRADEMEVDWDRWAKRLSPTHEALAESLHEADFTRHFLFQLCQQAEAAHWTEELTLRFFLAVMMWGYGDKDNRGPWRTAKALSDAPQLISSLEFARRQLLGPVCPPESRLAAAFQIFLKKPTMIPWVNESFFTKLMYFLGYEQLLDEEVKPLILDQRVCLGIMRHAAPYDDAETLLSFGPTGTATGFCHYCEWMHGWAHELGIEPDRLEWFFFTEGGNEDASEG